MTALSRLLPLLGILTIALTVGDTLAFAGGTHGYDFRAYYAAAGRVLDGGSAYDQAYELAGAGGLFFYPPLFVPLVLPFATLPTATATWAWTVLLLVAFAGAVVAMPVQWQTRWTVVLLAGLSFPFVHNIKLGQVGPILLLLFALSWRWLDRPAAFGVLGGIGAAIKVQPGLLLLWALLRRQWAAVVTGTLTLGVLALVALVVTGPGAWSDFIGLLARVSDPIATPQNTTPGATAWQLGAAREVAGWIQVVSTLAVAGAFIAAALWLPAEASLMVAIIATQLLSPILWDHYAIVLLLPAAWLLDCGRRWAICIPLVTPVFLVGLMPPLVYPLVFAVTLVLVFAQGLHMRDQPLQGVPTLA